MSLRSGLGIYRADSVTTAELSGASDPGLAFAGGAQGEPGELSGRDFSPLPALHRGVLDQPNALFVQHAVRHESLAMDHVLHVQAAVRASQLESAARNARVDAYHSAIPGMVTLFDPFALGAPLAGAGRAIGAADAGDAEATPSSAPADSHAGHDGRAADAQGTQTRNLSAWSESPPAQLRAAPGFSSQLRQVAAEFRPHTAWRATPLLDNTMTHRMQRNFMSMV